MSQRNFKENELVTISSIQCQALRLSFILQMAWDELCTMRAQLTEIEQKEIKQTLSELERCGETSTLNDPPGKLSTPAKR